MACANNGEKTDMMIPMTQLDKKICELDTAKLVGQASDVITDMLEGAWEESRRPVLTFNHNGREMQLQVVVTAEQDDFID